MPLPPVTEITEVPKLQFSHVECLMYTFHKLCKQTPEFLMKDPEQLKEFRLRLQYFARGIQGYIKKLREAISGKSEEELKSEENQLKVVALKTTNNINSLIKDLFHSPPSFKSIIHLSWKTTANDKKVRIKAVIILLEMWYFEYYNTFFVSYFRMKSIHLLKKDIHPLRLEMIVMQINEVKKIKVKGNYILLLVENTAQTYHQIMVIEEAFLFHKIIFRNKIKIYLYIFCYRSR